MDTLMHYLESIHPLPDGLKTYLAQNLKLWQIKKKEYLLKAGHASRHVCFIHTGLLRCFYVNGTMEVPSGVYERRRCVFSGDSFYKQTPSYESIQTLEDAYIF